MKCLSPLPDELREQVLLAMRPGESPVWVARPIPTLRNRMSTPYIFFAVFGMMFSGLILVLSPHAVLSFSVLLVGIPFVFIWYIYRQMKRTVYVITEKRALVVRPVRRKEWETLSWQLTPGLVKERVLRADGSGDLILSYEVEKDAEGDGQSVPRGFFNLPELRRVEQLLSEITPPSGQ